MVTEGTCLSSVAAHPSPLGSIRNNQTRSKVLQVQGLPNSGLQVSSHMVSAQEKNAVPMQVQVSEVH